MLKLSSAKIEIDGLFSPSSNQMDGGKKYPFLFHSLQKLFHKK